VLWTGFRPKAASSSVAAHPRKNCGTIVIPARAMAAPMYTEPPPAAPKPRSCAIYAALDCSPVVELCHLEAALAVWDYCRSSARLFFDTAPIDPAASRISQALDVNPQGLSKTQLRGLFHHHISKERIELALEQLISLGLIRNETAPGRGRSSIMWAKASKAADAPLLKLIKHPLFSRKRVTERSWRPGQSEVRQI
jgi:hypothetical protein